MLDVEVTASDGLGLSAAQVIVVTIMDEPEAPVITSGGGAEAFGVSLPEGETEITTVTAEDVDANTTLSFEIAGGPDEAKLTIDPLSGELSFVEAPNFETPTDADGDNVYQVDVVVFDDSDLSDSQSISVTVSDVDENPIIEADSEIEILENETNVFALGATDEGLDSTGAALTWSIEEGGDGSLFEIDADTGQISFAEAPDFESPADDNTDNAYVLTVSVSDPDGLADSLQVTVSVANVLESPTIDGPDEGPLARLVAESQTVVGTFTAFDDEDSLNELQLSWSVTGGDDQTLFSFTGNELSFNEATNFEAATDQNGDNVYELQITVTDSDGMTATRDVTVEVRNVPEVPQIDDSDVEPTTRDVAEGELLVDSFTATDDEDNAAGVPLIWSIAGGADDELFTFFGNELLFVERPNFEDPADADSDNVYNVQIQVTDSDGLFDTYEVDVNVINTEENPRIDEEQPVVREAIENTKIVGQFTASDDEDGLTEQPLTWSVTGGADASLFSFDGNVLSFNEAPDFENPGDEDGDNAYELQITVTDSSGLTDAIDVTVIVSDVSEAPEIDDAELEPTTREVSENETFVDTFTATDDEDNLNEVPLSWSVFGGADGHLFAFEGNALSFVNAANFELPADADGDNVYVVQIQVTDSDGLSDTYDVNVLVTDVRESPTIVGGEDVTVREVAEGATSVGQFSALDDEDNLTETPMAWSVSGGADGELFSFAGNELSFHEAPNFESPADENGDNVYEVQIQVTDSDGMSDTYDVTVVVTNVPERPTIRNSDVEPTTREVLEGGTLVSEFSASDEEDDSKGVRLNWSVSGGTDGELFTFDGNRLSFVAPANFESPADANGDNIYEVQIQVTDSDGMSDTYDVNVSVMDEKEAPVILGGEQQAAQIVAEGETVVGTFSASDDEDDLTETPMTWSVSGGADGELFSFAGNELSFNEAPNFESPADENDDNIYEVQIQVMDSDGQTDTFAVTVAVTDVSEPPTIDDSDIEPTTREVPENETFVDKFTAADDEDNLNEVPLVWSVSGGADGELFAFEGNALSFVNAANFEVPADANGDNIYEVQIQVTDTDGLSDTYDVNVIVTDVKENPVIAEGEDATTREVAENSTKVDTFAATDDEDGLSGTPLSWSVSGGADGALFSFEGNELGFNDPQNFENPTDENGDNNYEVEITATDSDGLTDTYSVTVVLTDIAESPTIQITDRSELSFEVFERTTNVATFSATDDEDDAAEIELTWTVSGGADEGRFTIDGGSLSFVEPPNFEAPTDFDGNNVYEVEIAVTDSTGFSDLVGVEVRVADVLESPSISGADKLQLRVESDRRIIHKFTATDADDDLAGIPLRWQVSGPDAERFSIDASGRLRFAEPPVLTASAAKSADRVDASLFLSMNPSIPFTFNEDSTRVINVQVSDSDGLVDTVQVSVTEGAPTPFDLKVENNRVIAVGTDGDDAFDLTLGEQTHFLSINGREYEFDATEVDTFHLGAGLASGNDSVKVTGLAHAEKATAFGDRGHFWSDAYHVYTYSFDNLKFDGGEGNDYAQIYGSRESDKLNGFPQDSKLTTPYHEFQMTGFDRVDSYGLGGHDYAEVYGTNDRDLFHTYDGYQVMQGPGHYQVTKGFERVDAYGRLGEDSAYLSDTEGDDRMFAFPTHVVMVTPQTQSTAKGFGEVETVSEKGGHDIAYLWRLTSEDHLIAADDIATLQSPNRTLTTKGFPVIGAKAQEGERPTSQVSEIDFAFANEEDWLLG